jgi:hypothetical protein
MPTTTIIDYRAVPRASRAKPTYALCTDSEQSRFLTTENKWRLAPNAKIRLFASRAAIDAFVRSPEAVPAIYALNRAFPDVGTMPIQFTPPAPRADLRGATKVTPSYSLRSFERR